MKKVISSGISFNAKFSGNGCVNFDTPEQHYYLNAVGLLKGKSYNNVMYVKKMFGLDENGIGFKPKVSSECIRHAMFVDEMDVQVNENVMQLPNVLYNALAMPALIERGYMYAVKDAKTIKKKSIVTITDAVEDTDTLRHDISIDVHTRNVKKEDTKDQEQKDTSFYSIENIGECTYKSIGFINLDELQFISCDDTYDRCAVDFDVKTNEDIYMSALKRNLPNGGKMGYYYMNNNYTQDEWAERGILLGKEDVDFMTKDILKRLLNVHIERRNALFYITSLEISYYDEDGSLKIEEITKNNIDDFEFIPKGKYKEADETLIIENKKMYDTLKASKKSKK